MKSKNLKIVLIGAACFYSLSITAQLRSAGTGSGNVVYSTSPTIATPSFTTGFTIGGAATAGKIPIGNGTNYIASTPKYPNTSPTSRKILVSDGTDIVASTELWPVPGATAGVTMIGNGTDWTAINTRTNWTSFVVSGSNATTTGQVLVDITGLTSGTLSNSTLYEVEAWLYVNTTAVSTGTQYAIAAGGSGGAAVYSALVIGTTTTNAVTSVTQSSATQQGTFLTTSSASGVIYLHGFITTRGAGTATISIQHLKVTSGTSTVNIGSKMQIRLAN